MGRGRSFRVGAPCSKDLALKLERAQFKVEFEACGCRVGGRRTRRARRDGARRSLRSLSRRPLNASIVGRTGALPNDNATTADYRRRSERSSSTLSRTPSSRSGGYESDSLIPQGYPRYRPKISISYSTTPPLLWRAMTCQACTSAREGPRQPTTVRSSSSRFESSCRRKAVRFKWRSVSGKGDARDPVWRDLPRSEGSDPRWASDCRGCNRLSSRCQPTRRRIRSTQRRHLRRDGTPPDQACGIVR